MTTQPPPLRWVLTVQDDKVYGIEPGVTLDEAVPPLEGFTAIEVVEVDRRDY